MPSLRIVYDNAADSGTLTATSTAGSLAATNMQIDKKSKVWRSVGTSATLTCSWSSIKLINCVILPFCNFSSTATAIVRVYDAASGGTLLYTSPSTLVTPTVPVGYWGLGTQPLGVNAYSYGFSQHARVWLPSTYSARRVEITITDSSNPSGYLEVARFVTGNYWSPMYNTGFGIPLVTIDSSVQSRSQAGDLITSVGFKYKKMSIDLNWLVDSDRSRFLAMLQTNGSAKAVFVSVFPEDVDTLKEQSYQIFGKLPAQTQVTHPMHTIYSSQIELEEV
jgi:hypothetical protein